MGTVSSDLSGCPAELGNREQEGKDTLVYTEKNLGSSSSSAQLYLTLCDAMDGSPPGCSVHGFPRQDYWSGSSCPPPEDLPDPGSNLRLLCLLHWQADSLPLSHLGSP